MHMHKAFTLTVLAGFLLHPSGASGQVPRESTFDCGRISLSPSGKSITYYDLGRGFRFEFPADWLGNRVILSDPADNACTSPFHCPSQILVNPLLATSDPRFYVSEGAMVTGTEAVNGLQWTALSWPNGRRGYYTYRDGVAIEFIAMPFGKSRAPSSTALAAMTQILSNFSFLDDAARLDRQIASLRTGQKLGSLTIERIVPGKGGFGGDIAKVEFSGQLKLTGTVGLESTMGGGTSGYFFVESHRGNAAAIPQLSCPVEDVENILPKRVAFSNQEFAQQQFGKHNWYDAGATVVVEKVVETFSSDGVGASVSARLVAVPEKNKTPP